MSQTNLLLVDADERTRRVMEVSLRKAGFHVATAVDGEDALRKLRGPGPDLIISDTDLPELDGFELCKQLKQEQRWTNIPFIFLTRSRTVEDKIRGLELGVEEYLTKPIFLMELVVRIKMVLQKRRRETLSTPEAQTTFNGTLSDMNVVDLIQMMELGRKSGIVHLTAGPTLRGAIFFRDGKSIDAELQHLQGEPAIYRLLTWNDGQFEVEFKTIRRKDVIGVSNQALLVEGMRRLDEWGRLLEQLPALDSVFEVDYAELAERLGELPDEINGIIRLFDGHRTLLQVVDDCDFDDHKALTIIGKLYFEGLVYDVARGPVHAPQAIAPPPAADAHPKNRASQRDEMREARDIPPEEAFADALDAATVSPTPATKTASTLRDMPAINVPERAAKPNDTPTDAGRDTGTLPPRWEPASTAEQGDTTENEDEASGRAAQHEWAEDTRKAQKPPSVRGTPTLRVPASAGTPVGKLRPKKRSSTDRFTPGAHAATREQPGGTAQAPLSPFTTGQPDRAQAGPTARSRTKQDWAAVSATAKTPTATPEPSRQAELDATVAAPRRTPTPVPPKQPVSQSATSGIEPPAAAAAPTQKRSQRIASSDRRAKPTPVVDPAAGEAFAATGTSDSTSEASIDTQEETFFSADLEEDLLPGELYGDGQSRLRQVRWLVIAAAALLLGVGGYAAFKTARSSGDGATTRPGLSLPTAQKPAPSPAAPTGTTRTVPAGVETPASQPVVAADTGDAAASQPAVAQTPAAVATAAAPEAAASQPSDGGPAAADDEYTRLVTRAKTLLAKHRSRAAAKLFRQALAINAQGWLALEQLALYTLSQGRSRQALDMARRAEAVHRDAPYAQLVIGAVMHERRQTAEAKAAYARFIELCPDCQHSGEIKAILKSM